MLVPSVNAARPQLNIGDSMVGIMKAFLSSLLHVMYGIKLRWEEQEQGKVVRGEGCPTCDTDEVSFNDQGVTTSLDMRSSFECDKWWIVFLHMPGLSGIATFRHGPPLRTHMSRITYGP